jgi:hypothetical protein
MKKNDDVVPRTLPVEAPLVCVLPDASKTHLDQLINEKRSCQYHDQCRPNLNSRDKLKCFFTYGSQFAHEFLPQKYQFGGNVLHRLTEFLMSDAQKKRKRLIREPKSSAVSKSY